MSKTDRLAARQTTSGHLQASQREVSLQLTEELFEAGCATEATSRRCHVHQGGTSKG